MYIHAIVFAYPKEKGNSLIKRTHNMVIFGCFQAHMNKFEIMKLARHGEKASLSVLTLNAMHLYRNNQVNVKMKRGKLKRDWEKLMR